MTGSISNSWKIAIVTPVGECHNPTSYQDFRPISVTPVLSRLHEKIIVKNFIQPPSHDLVQGDQFGFRSEGSTTAALIALILRVTQCLESND